MTLSIDGRIGIDSDRRCDGDAAILVEGHIAATGQGIEQVLFSTTGYRPIGASGQRKQANQASGGQPGQQGPLNATLECRVLRPHIDKAWNLSTCKVMRVFRWRWC